VRAADGRPANIHDFLPVDGKFKLFVFAGDVSVPAQVTRLEELAKVLYGHASEDSEQTSAQEPFWKIQGKDVRDELVQTYAIAHGTDLVTVQTDVKAAMGLNWTKCVLSSATSIYMTDSLSFSIFVDAVDAFTPPQGELFRGFGVDSSGAVVVVRPDGFIGALAPVGAEAHPVLASYFKGLSS
jgi:phenol 2-monooxygenase